MGSLCDDASVGCVCVCLQEAARLEIVGSAFRLAMTDVQYGDMLIPKGRLVCLYTGAPTCPPSLLSLPGCV